MKIAVSSRGPTLSDPVDSRFGRAAWFIVVDVETNKWQAVENQQNFQAAQGAGIQSAECVSRHDVGAVLTGHCGPKAFRALKAADIKIFTSVEGTVAEAVEQYKAGTLTASGDADVEGHWA